MLSPTSFILLLFYLLLLQHFNLARASAAYPAIPRGERLLLIQFQYDPPIGVFLPGITLDTCPTRVAKLISARGTSQRERNT